MAIFWDSEKDIFDNGTGIEISDKEAKDFLKIAYLLAQTELDGTMKKINEFELIEKKQYDELKRKNDDLKE